MKGLKRLTLFWSSAVAGLLLTSSLGHAKAINSEKPYTLTTWNKKTADGYRGFFKVPENRAIKDSRNLSIQYIRFPSTGKKAGPPIVYLAGGPGGSGIMAVNYRYEMFMALREYGDVIALDQRGTGHSNDLPSCQSNQVVPPLISTSDSKYVELHQSALLECLSFWRDQGVDLAAYNTLESARDLEALRHHLGEEKIVLWGTSYGSHLALAALKEIEGSIDRIILSSAEGLNQTIKLPSRTESYLDRLQKAIDQQPEAKAIYPDIKGLIHRIHAKLEKQPLKIQLPQRDGSKLDTLLQRRDMQQIASAFIADPKSAAQLLAFYRAIDLREVPAFDKAPSRYFPDGFLQPGAPITLRPMPTAMDIASGIDKGRKAKVAEQAKASLLGDYLNFSYHYDGLAPELDLGNRFRANPQSDVPVLLFSGTLDGRTYIESQHEAVSGLSNTTLVTVKNAGHNLFMASEEVQDTINLFLEGRPIEKTTITVDLPTLAIK
ncbi:alpha/beta hydrolase [Microbulbifer sp. MLAF003]|uniref:alpha/beta hydrolase n=1 Tax=unclassified Microbulbifer TaxID=2619833 RepID=UPI0024ACBF93|nr:alpha/beta hydrolase [Microbulbifer sp. MLAF003]WHI52612.1 alpha/beta hydrolase [Microbulbifer sp. MLAF003]